MEQKMNEYRYFIADDNKTGTLIFSNEIKGEDMLLLVGYVIYFYNAASVDDIVDKLVTMYGFSVRKEHITAFDSTLPYLRFLPFGRRRTIILFEAFFGRRVRTSPLPHGETGGLPPRVRPPCG